MTVKQLIKALKKEDQNAIVLLSDHDHAEDEYNGYANKYIYELIPSECDEDSPAYTRLDHDQTYVKIGVS